MTMDHIDRLPTSSTQARAAGVTRRAALGIAGVLSLSHGHLADVAAGKRKRRRKKDRKKKRKGTTPLRVRFVRSWGNQGTGNGQFDDLNGLAVAPNGDVYVADNRNNRMQFFDASGNFLGQFAIDTRPRDIEVAANRDVFVTARADETEQIQRFSAGGTILDAIGGPGAGNGQFQNLFTLAIAATGDVYALDLSPRIQQFSPDGTFIRAFGQEGSGDGDLVLQRRFSPKALKPRYIGASDA